MSTTFDSPGTTVAQRIAQALPRLSRSHRQVADYVLEHPLQVATLPIDEEILAQKWAITHPDLAPLEERS